MESPRGRGLRSRIAEELFTYFAFWIAVAAFPALAVSYVVVRVSKHLWLKFLSSRYRHLEFIRTDTIRSLLDTHRNQGIINVLLCVKGALNMEEINRQLKHHLLERRNQNGEFMFPRLRQSLVSCWGNYAWENTHFRPENHIILANAVHRARPVSDNNIQDYVSEIISKYFPSDQSPWQYIIIPYGSSEPKFYILVRVHHLLLTGKKSINIGDLLMVEQATQEPISQQSEYSQSLMAKLLPIPSAIPELMEKINEMLSNAWNEFVSEYDPVESTRALKTLPGVFHVAGLVLMCAVSALRDLNKKRYTRKDSMTGAPLTAISLVTGIHRELRRRNLTIQRAVVSPLVTLDPRKWPGFAIGTTCSFLRAVVKMPLSIRDEIIALKELKKSGRVLYPNTLTWKYAGLLQLSSRACIEAWRVILEVYRAPLKMWTMVQTENGQRHVLQTVSLCGRKVTAWSKPVSRAGIDRTARVLGVSSSDIALFAATESLKAYFDQTHNLPPESVLVTARAATEEFLFTFAEGNGKNYKKSQTGGMVCLALPVGATPRRIALVVEQACNRQGTLAAIWAAQARYGALTRAVPSPLARLTMNLLSRRFAVSYAEINSPSAGRQRQTVWGQELESVLYWRPPQANISMSLTVIQYADSVRLAVMSDARVAPYHTIPAARWPAAIDQLVSKVDQEIARISAQIPRIVETSAQETDDSRDEGDLGEPLEGRLKPPATQIVSPPPSRRRTVN